MTTTDAQQWHGDLLPGAEPWARDGGSVGVVCLHNFTAHPGVMRNIGERMVAAGYTVDVPLFSGHGRHVNDIVPIRWPDIRQDALDAYERVGAKTDQVVLVGAGCGGICSLYLASTGLPLAGVAVVSAPTGSLDPDLVANVERIVASGREITTEEELPGASDINKADGHNVPPDGTPARTFLSLAGAAAQLDISAISCPVLGFYAPADRTLLHAWRHAERLQREAQGTVEIVQLTRSSHMATVDHDQQMIEDRIAEFVASVTS